MKKLTLFLTLFLIAFALNAQDQAKITIPDAWSDASEDNNGILIKWVTRAELSPIAGTKEYVISDMWNPSNADLNQIAVNGGDTENWPLYFIVNDTNFFYEPVDPIMGDNIRALKSGLHTPLKTWGEYLKQSHEVYYRSATSPDQYWILAADVNGNRLKLSELIDIRNNYTEIVGYVTSPTVDANGDKVQRNTTTGLFP